MSKPVRFAREARAELHEAARRYGEQRSGLRIEFLAAVDEAMEHLVRLAKHLGSPPGIDPILGIKARLCEALPVLGLLHRVADPFPGARGRARSAAPILLGRPALIREVRDIGVAALRT